MLLAQATVSLNLISWVAGSIVSVFAIVGGVITVLRFTRERIQDQIALSLAQCPFKAEVSKSVTRVHARLDDMSALMIKNQINGDIVDLNHNLQKVANAISPELGTSLREIPTRKPDADLIKRLRRKDQDEPNPGRRDTNNNPEDKDHE